jgi:cohesin loading factor subunit SCC2
MMPAVRYGLLFICRLVLLLWVHLHETWCNCVLKIQSFSLKEPPKSGETFSRQNIPFNVSSTNISLPSCLQDVASVYQVLNSELKIPWQNKAV